MSYDETSHHETISDQTQTEFQTVVIKLLDEIVQIMGEWNGDESGELEDRSDIAEELSEHLRESVKLIEELI